MGDTLTSIRSARSVAASLASREERETRLTSSLRCHLDDMRHTPEPILIIAAALIAALLVMGFAAFTSLLYNGLNAMIAGKSRCGHLVEDEEENTVIEEIVDATDPILSYSHGYIVVTPSAQPQVKNDRTLVELFSNSFPPNVCLNAGLFTQQDPNHAELYDKSSVLRLETELNRPDSHRRTLSDLSHGSSASHQDLKRSRLDSRSDVSSSKACDSNVGIPGHTPALQSGSTLSDLCYSDDSSQDLPDPDPATHHSQNHRCSWSIITQSGAKKANEEDHQQKASALPVPLGNYYSHQYHLHDWDDISDLSSADGEPPIECHTPRTRTRSEITCDDNASTPQPLLKRSRHNRSRSPVRPASPPIDPSPHHRQHEHRSRASGYTDGESEQSSEVGRAALPTGPTQRTLIRHQSDRLPTSSHQNEELPPRRAVSAPAKSAVQCPFERQVDHPFDTFAAAPTRSPAGCTTSPHNSSVNNITIYNTPPHRPRSPPNVKVKGFDDVDDVEVLKADNMQLSSALCALPSAPPLSSTDSPPLSTKSAKSKSFWKTMKSWIPGSAPRKGATEVPNVDDTTIVTAENAISNSSNEASSSQYNNWDRLKLQLGVSVHNVFVGGLYEHESGRR